MIRTIMLITVIGVGAISGYALGNTFGLVGVVLSPIVGGLVGVGTISLYEEYK